MILGASPIALGSAPRRLRFLLLGLIGGLAAWTGGSLYQEFESVRDAQLSAGAEEAARLAEQTAFADTVGIREDRSVEIAKGETLASVIRRAGAQGDDVRQIVSNVSTIYDARRIRPGQKVDVFFETDGARARLTGVAFRSQPGAAITVNRTYDGAFRAREVLMPLTFEVTRIAGAIETSIYSSAVGGGATDREVSQLADIFSYDVDFQRDVQRGDGFEMVFERFRDDDGATVRTGDLLFVGLDVKGQRREFYRYQRPGDVDPDYYDYQGRSARKFLMKTPINGARLSSGFGFRRHPILGYSALHKGTDFAAASGTPIMAAGDGVIVQAGRNGGYGNYIRVRHGDGYETAYAHMSRFAGGSRAGARVRQGQVIGFVGSTGRSTGPHLHYEVLYRGRHMNPMDLKVRTGRNLDAAELKSFVAERDRIDRMRLVEEREAQERANLASTTTAMIVPIRASDLRGALQ